MKIKKIDPTEIELSHHTYKQEPWGKSPASLKTEFGMELREPLEDEDRFKGDPRFDDNFWGAIWFTFDNKINELHIYLGPETLIEQQVIAAPCELTHFEIEGNYIGGDAYMTYLRVEPTWDMEEGWLFKITEAKGGFGGDLTVSAEDIFNSIICSELASIGFGVRNHDQKVTSLFLKFPILRIDLLRELAVDALGLKYIKKLLLRRGLEIDLE